MKDDDQSGTISWNYERYEVSVFSSPGYWADGVVVITVDVKSSEELTYYFYLHASTEQEAQARYRRQKDSFGSVVT